MIGRGQGATFEPREGCTRSGLALVAGRGAGDRRVRSSASVRVPDSEQRPRQGRRRCKFVQVHRESVHRAPPRRHGHRARRARRSQFARRRTARRTNRKSRAGARARAATTRTTL